MSLRKVAIDLLYRRIFENVYATEHKQRCLISYVAKPFLFFPHLKEFALRNATHQNLWQAVAIADIVNELGYVVDIVDYSYTDVIPSQVYDLIIDVHPRQHPIYEKCLKQGGVRIAYITGPNPLFSNKAEQIRLRALLKRKKVNLSRKMIALPFPNSMNDYDAIFFIGNRYNLKQYSAFDRPQKYCIPNTGITEIYPQTDYIRDSQSFVYVGSGGQVFRGLDLLLEVFAVHPELKLYVFGPYEKEVDFCHAFHRELFETPNIHAMGFTNTRGEAFKRIAHSSAYSLLLSCAEGQSGSVLTTMSAGLIPLATPECGLDSNEVVLVKDISLGKIEQMVLGMSRRPQSWIKVQSSRAVENIKQHHTAYTFQSTWRNALLDILPS